MKIIYYPNKILYQAAELVTDFKETKNYVNQMFKLMYNHYGIGLAAPQVGICKRFFIINIDPPEKQSEKIFINPIIISNDQEFLGNEGCLSLPGITGRVRRYHIIEVNAFDLDGKEFNLKAEGLLAQAIQHEIDHLHGVLIIDKMEKTDRLLMATRIKKLEGNRY